MSVAFEARFRARVRVTLRMPATIEAIRMAPNELMPVAVMARVPSCTRPPNRPRDASLHPRPPEASAKPAETTAAPRTVRAQRESSICSVSM